MDRAYQIQCCRWQDAIGAVGMVDHTISDPPNDEQTHAGHRNIASGSNESPIDFNSLESFAHVAAARIVTRRWMLFFCSLEHLGEYKRA